MKKIVSIFFTFILLVSCSSSKNAVNNESTGNNENTEFVSIISLISNPDLYHNKIITVSGYFDLYQKHGKAIYLSIEDFNNSIFKNGLSLKTSEDSLKEKFDFDSPYRGYVKITGKFNKNEKGSYNFYSGTIENITDIYRLKE